MSSKSRARSSFGNVDRLDSGKWRARYTGPDGRRRSATFKTKSDARAWLSTVTSLQCGALISKGQVGLGRPSC